MLINHKIIEIKNRKMGTIYTLTSIYKFIFCFSNTSGN